MDVLVRPDGEKPGSWSLTDRLSRPWGRIVVATDGAFLIEVDIDEGQSALRPGPHYTLDDAMSEVARYTRGQVQLIDQSRTWGPC